MTAWDFDRADAVRAKVAGLGAGALAVQDAAERAGVEVPASVRESYEKAEHDEQYTALAASLPAAAAAVTAVGAAERASAQDRDPLSALGATLLGVDDRAADRGALLDEGQYAEATQAAADATSRSDKAMLVGLALPLLLLLLVAGAALWGRAFVRASARQRADDEATLAALAAPPPRCSGRPAAPGIRRG